MEKKTWKVVTVIIVFTMLVGISFGLYYASDRASVVASIFFGFAFSGGIKAKHNPVYLMLRALAPPEQKEKIAERERTSSIEDNDERNKLIRAYSHAISGTFLRWCVMGLVALLYLFAQPLWLAHTALCIVIARDIFNHISVSRYERKM